jgi:hypothetical protein
MDDDEQVYMMHGRLQHVGSSAELEHHRVSIGKAKSHIVKRATIVVGNPKDPGRGHKVGSLYPLSGSLPLDVGIFIMLRSCLGHGDACEGCIMICLWLSKAASFCQAQLTQKVCKNTIL